MADDQYGLFQDDIKGAMWRADVGDLYLAKIEAKKLADQENLVFFIYCFKTKMEVARIKPTKVKPTGNR